MFDFIRWVAVQAPGLRNNDEQRGGDRVAKGRPMECDKCEHAGERCWCHLEWHCEHAGIARLFSEHSHYGDKFCYALPFVVRERFSKVDKNGRRGLLEFIGVMQIPTLCQYRAWRRACAEQGWGVLSKRMKHGKSRTIEICKRHPHAE